MAMPVSFAVCISCTVLLQDLAAFESHCPPCRMDFDHRKSISAGTSSLTPYYQKITTCPAHNVIALTLDLPSGSPPHCSPGAYVVSLSRLELFCLRAAPPPCGTYVSLQAYFVTEG